jgi:hypothetical protein
MADKDNISMAATKVGNFLNTLYHHDMIERLAAI